MEKLSNEKNVTISLRLDGTKVLPDLTLSTIYGAILDGTEPNHLSMKEIFLKNSPKQSLTQNWILGELLR